MSSERIVFCRDTAAVGGKDVDEQDQRDQLFDRAKYGELTGDEADAEAIRLGLGRLSHIPNRDEFRPEAEPQWTITMAVAWLVYLDLEQVREWFAPYRGACTHWIWRRWRNGPTGGVSEGWLLEGRSKPTLARLGMGSLWDNRGDNLSQYMTVREAQEALWMALREGLFVASGIPLQSDRRTEIPPLDWNELVAVEGRGERDEVRYGQLGTGYRDVLVPARSIQGHWRKPKEKHDLWTPLMPPNGDGYMPLYCAAQWIATEGGTVDFDAEDELKWRSAFDQLLKAIASEKVRVVGVRDGMREPVPGYHFAGCVVDYPYSGSSVSLIRSDTMYLRSTPYIDEEHWRSGFDDALVNRHRDYWKQLMVERTGVRERWPFTLGEINKTGAPGRPSLSMHLIRDELLRRAKAGTCKERVGQESVALVDWLAETHPLNPRPTPKAVENNIRDKFRELQAHPK